MQKKSNICGSFAGILMAVIAVITAVLLVRVHASAVTMSRTAEALNMAVNTCRSILAADMASTSADALKENLQAFGSIETTDVNQISFTLNDMNAKIQGEQIYTAWLTREPSEEENLEKITVTVLCEGKEVYSLETMQYTGAQTEGGEE